MKQEPSYLGVWESHTSGWGGCQVNIEYTYKRSPESIVKDATTSQTTKQVGRLGVVTQTDIDAKMAEVEEHQRQTLEQFKIYVEQKRKAFREQVNKETAERDQQLQLQEI